MSTGAHTLLLSLQSPPDCVRSVRSITQLDGDPNFFTPLCANGGALALRSLLIGWAAEGRGDKTAGILFSTVNQRGARK